MAILTPTGFRNKVHMWLQLRDSALAAPESTDSGKPDGAQGSSHSG